MMSLLRPFSRWRLVTSVAVAVLLMASGTARGGDGDSTELTARGQVIAADEHLPEGVRGETAVTKYDAAQLDIEGYDPDVFCSMEFIDIRQHDPNDDRTRRSHLCEIVSTKINKMVTLPVLKDHGSGGGSDATLSCRAPVAPSARYVPHDAAGKNLVEEDREVILP